MPKKIGFKYAYSPKQIEDVLANVRDKGRPDTLVFSYIRDNWLLKNGQYGNVLDILSDMGFTDTSKKPTELYGRYQNHTTSKIALAEGIKNAYPDLFKAHPNAYSLDKEFLKGYFKQHTGADSSVVDKIYSTFTKLCSLAEFSTGGIPSGLSEEVKLPNFQSNGKINNENGNGNFSFPLSFNFEIIIPSDATPEKYDAIFSAIKKNLMSNK
jgi:hypothetical protein